VRDIPKNEVWWSNEIYRMTGRTRQEWGSGSLDAFLDIVHPDDRDNVVQAIQVAIREHKPYSVDHRFIHLDGTECLVHEQGEVTYDESGEAIQITGTVQDITKRKQIEAELEKHRHQLENLVAERTAELNQEIAQRIEIQEALRQSELEKAITEERRRLARDLHDSVTQSLHSSTMLAEAGQRLAGSGNIERARGYLIRIGDISQQALKEMRLLVYELRPLALNEIGLVGALQQRLDAVERRAGVEAQLHIDEEVEIPARIEEELFRVAMEALNNALKHAEPSTVTVNLRVEEKGDIPCLEVEIIDDGKGFDPESLGDEGGMGLVSMGERIEELGGELTVLSTPGEGTRVKACVDLVTDPGSKGSSEA
jgi:PAS domain S-box-containing protein